MQKKSPVPAFRTLRGVTPYPWRRNYKGDLCGADGQPIYFRGADAVLVEHAPELAEALEKICFMSSSKSANHAADLKTVRRIATELISRIEKSRRDHQWCRGTVQ